MYVPKERRKVLLPYLFGGGGHKIFKGKQKTQQHQVPRSSNDLEAGSYSTESLSTRRRDGLDEVASRLLDDTSQQFVDEASQTFSASPEHLFKLGSNVRGAQSLPQMTFHPNHPLTAEVLAAGTPSSSFAPELGDDSSMHVTPPPIPRKSSKRNLLGQQSSHAGKDSGANSKHATSEPLVISNPVLVDGPESVPGAAVDVNAKIQNLLETMDKLKVEKTPSGKTRANRRSTSEHGFLKKIKSCTFLLGRSSPVVVPSPVLSEQRTLYPKYVRDNSPLFEPLSSTCKDSCLSPAMRTDLIRVNESLNFQSKGAKLSALTGSCKIPRKPLIDDGASLQRMQPSTHGNYPVTPERQGLAHSAEMSSSPLALSTPRMRLKGSTNVPGPSRSKFNLDDSQSPVRSINDTDPFADDVQAGASARVASSTAEGSVVGPAKRSKSAVSTRESKRGEAPKKRAKVPIARNHVSVKKHPSPSSKDLEDYARIMHLRERHPQVIREAQNIEEVVPHMLYQNLPSDTSLTDRPVNTSVSRGSAQSSFIRARRSVSSAAFPTRSHAYRHVSGRNHESHHSNRHDAEAMDIDDLQKENVAFE